jgi:hypothetical protein
VAEGWCSTLYNLHPSDTTKTMGFSFISTHGIWEDLPLLLQAWRLLRALFWKARRAALPGKTEVL